MGRPDPRHSKDQLPSNRLSPPPALSPATAAGYQRSFWPYSIVPPSPAE